MLLDLWALFPFKRGGDDAGGGWVKEQKPKKKQASVKSFQELPKIVTVAQKVAFSVTLPKVSTSDDEDAMFLLLI